MDRASQANRQRWEVEDLLSRLGYVIPPPVLSSSLLSFAPAQPPHPTPAALRTLNPSRTTPRVRSRRFFDQRPLTVPCLEQVWPRVKFTERVEARVRAVAGTLATAALSSPVGRLCARFKSNRHHGQLGGVVLGVCALGSALGVILVLSLINHSLP